MMKRILLMAACLFAMAPVLATAQTNEPEVIAEGLHNPCGVAIQPGTNHVFVADSGNLRVVRIVDGKVEDVITDFPKDIYGKGPMYDIGPLGLFFIDQNTLVVGGGGLPDGDELLRVYKVPAAGKDPIKADAMIGDGLKLAADEEKELKGEGNFYALAKAGTGIYVTCNGDDTKGWISRAEIKDGKLVDFERFIATKEATEVDAPVGITLSPDGFLAVGQMGEINVEGDSLLTFYDEKGKLLDNFEIKLNDITALAYGPKRGRLYVTDFNWLDTTKGGLFKLIATSDEAGCKAVEIMKLDKPTAMVFDADGNLYVTVCGTKGEGEDAKPAGKLLMIKGLDEDPNKKPEDKDKEEDKEEKKDDDSGDDKDKDSGDDKKDDK